MKKIILSAIITASFIANAGQLEIQNNGGSVKITTNSKNELVLNGKVIKLESESSELKPLALYDSQNKFIGQPFFSGSDRFLITINNNKYVAKIGRDGDILSLPMTFIYKSMDDCNAESNPVYTNDFTYIKTFNNSIFSNDKNGELYTTNGKSISISSRESIDRIPHELYSKGRYSDDTCELFSPSSIFGSTLLEVDTIRSNDIRQEVFIITNPEYKDCYVDDNKKETCDIKSSNKSITIYKNYLANFKLPFTVK